MSIYLNVDVNELHKSPVEPPAPSDGPLMVSIIYALAFCVFNGKFVAQGTCLKIGKCIGVGWSGDFGGGRSTWPSHDSD